MRKRKIKTLFMSVLTVLCSVFVMSIAQESKVLAAENENVFEMTQGGSIRIVEPYGLRFQVKMSADVKNKADKVGMLIFPADYLVDNGTDGDVYYESVEALANTTNPKHRIKLDLTQKLYEKDGYWYGNGAIVNIKDKNMAREFTAIAYYTDKTTNQIVWADYETLDNTSRSAARVALMTYADDSNNYAKATMDLLHNYITYTKDVNLKNIGLPKLPLFVDNGADTACSYWSAEYTDNGVKIYADVRDKISIEANNIGMSDNVEFQIQAVDNYVKAHGYTINMLCNGEGATWLRRWSTGEGYVSEEISEDITSKNDTAYCLYEKTSEGYKVEFFVSYDILKVTKAEAQGAVRVLPMLRNRTDETHNSYAALELFGSQYDFPSTWFVLNENNQFTRKDMEEITLQAVSSQAEAMFSNLAEITSDYTMYKTVEGAPAMSNSIWCFDSLPREIYETDYVRGPKAGGETITVQKAGYVIILCGGTNTTMLEKLKTDNWTLLNDKARCALSLAGGLDNNFQYLSSYYGKYFEAGQTFEISGEYAVAFAKASKATAQFSWKSTPAYISFDAANDDYYSAEKNVFNACPSIAVTNGGRLIATYVTGGTFEPDYENSVVFAYSDDNGKTWTKAFVLDSWLNQEINGKKEDIVLEADLRVDPETNKLYVIYNLRMNRDGYIVMNSGAWLFTVDNPDADVSEWNVSEQVETGVGYVRNTFIILNDGRFAIVPNGYMNSKPNYIYFSSDEGKTWEEGGSIYVPQAFNFDEPVIVEKQDGTLWALFRTTLGEAYESFSYDGGKTWTVAKQSGIKNPSSRFSINRLESGNLMMVYNDNSSGRIGMVVAISDDDGMTWTNKMCLYDGIASYQAVALDYSSGEEVIHIIFDDGRYYANQWRTGVEDGKMYEYYAHIYHTALTEEEIMAGGDPSKEETELLIVGDSYTALSYWKGFESSFGTYGGESIGISGTKVADWNTEDKIAEIVAKNPKNLFINIGINDLREGADGQAVGNDIVNYLKSLKEALQDTNIYYNMIVYTAETFYSQDIITTSNEIVEAYIDGDTTDNVYKIDIREKMMRMGEVDSSKLSDKLHMTTEGYAILCDAIRKQTGIGRRVEGLNIITRASNRIYEYNWTAWEDCGIQSDAPTRYNVRGYAADEGLYINAVQYVDNIVKDGHQWNEQTHLEAQITQHNMGKGADYGFSTPTYAAFWLDGTSYLNSDTNVGTVKNHVTITDRGEDYADGYRYEICYEIFIPFDNNVGSADGPYAYIQFKHHMPGETEEGFEYANREFRDNARYLWQDNCKSYEFRNTGIVMKDFDYKNLGTVSGTNVATWDLNVYRAPSAFYLRVSTTDKIDTSVKTGVKMYMNLGEFTLDRTETIYSFDLFMQNGEVAYRATHFPNNKEVDANVSYIGSSYCVVNGKTTMCLMIPFDSFEDKISTENLAFTFRSFCGTTYRDWTYEGCYVNFSQPIKYLTITEDNQVYLLGEKAIQTTVKVNNALKAGYEDVFSNLAMISTNTGIMSTVTNGGFMFDDRTDSQNFVFDTLEAKFLDGKAYAYAGIAEGSFTVDKSGYVFLLLPETSSYATVRTNAVNDGWKKQFTSWNKMGSLSDPISYYVKWCESGESYSYGKWNIAVAASSSVQLFSTVQGVGFSSMGTGPLGNNPVSYQENVNQVLEGRTIKRIGVPVKQISACTQDSTMKVYRVADESPSTILEEYTLTIPANTYSSNNVDKWVYFNVDIFIGEGERIAFGSASDTIQYGYSSSALNDCAGMYLNIATNHRSYAGSLLFDLYCEVDEENEIEQLFSTVQGVGFSSMGTGPLGNNPVSYQENVNQVLEGRTIKKIGVPVKQISACTQDSTMKVYRVADESPSTILEEYTLTIPANTYSSNNVDKWVYFNVDIFIGEGERIAFGSASDTIQYGYSSSALNDCAGMYLNIATNHRSYAGSLLFDLYCEDAGDDLAGKYISFLGASFSTFKGYSNSTLYNSTIANNAQWYPNTGVDVTSVDHTWWMRTVNELDLKLCVNNSWSGSCVSTKKGTVEAACMTRATQLHNDKLGIDPDIIILIIGGNDTFQNVPIGTYNNVNDVYDKERGTYIGDCSKFAQAYATMVHKAKVRYPKADIYVCSMLEWQSIEEPYNMAVKQIADEFNLTYIDLYNKSGITPETADIYLHTDRIHPNKLGFEKVSDCIIEVLRDNYSE